MCLIVFALEAHPRYRLVLVANRDEEYARPTALAAPWEDAPGVIAGRDLRGGGTWLGVATGGRFAAVTNFHETVPPRQAAPSRGELVASFLTGDAPPSQHLRAISARSAEYNGFNLLLGDRRELVWFSNRAERPVVLEPGVYGLSNHLLDTPWPKVVRGKQALAALIEQGIAAAPEPLFQILAESDPAPDAELPDTGVERELERALSSLFIRTPVYGTRASTVLLVDRAGTATFVERSFAAGAERGEEVRHAFRSG